MKKVLSILLAFTFVVQPAYTIAQPAKPPKKGVVARAKEKWSAMGEAVKRGRTLLKENGTCLLLGKGKNCTPGRRGALRVIRDFTLGRTRNVRDGIKGFIQFNLGCFVSILTFLGIPVIATVASVEAGIRAVASSEEKMKKFKEVWTRWAARMSSGMKGGGLFPEVIEALVETESPELPNEMFVLAECTIILFLEIFLIAIVVSLAYERTPAGRRSSKKVTVWGKVITDLFDTMQQKMSDFQEDAATADVINALVQIFNKKKNAWPRTYKEFLRAHGLTGPEWDDEKLDIKTFDALGISDISKIKIGYKTLINLAFMPNLRLFPFGKYDKKRVALIDKLREKGVATEEFTWRIEDLKVGIKAIEEAQKKSSVPIDQRLLNDIANKAVKAARE